MPELPPGWKRRKPERRNPESFPPISAAHAEAIGRLTVAWPLIEGSMAVCARFLMGIDDEDGWAVTADMTGVALYNFIHALVWATREQEWVDEWKSLAPEFNALREFRNDVVHAEWKVVNPSHWALRITGKPFVRFEHEELSTDRIIQQTEKILDLLARIDVFAHNVCMPARIMAGTRRQRPPLQPGHSQQAQSLAQARAEKKAKKQKDRERDMNPLSGTGDAQPSEEPTHKDAPP